MANSTVGSDDYFAISDLYASQAQAIDEGDAVLYAATFANDAVFKASNFEIRGTQKIADLARSFYASSKTTQFRHWLGNFRFTPQAPTTIQATFCSMIIATSEDMTPKLTRMSFVTDKLEKIDGAWIITHRLSEADPRRRADLDKPPA